MIRSIAALLVAAAIAACPPPARAGDAPAANAPAGGTPLQVIRVADQPAAEVSYAAFWVADALGYFAEEGVKIERKTYANGPAGLLEFANGTVDAEMAAIAPFMEFAANGGKFRMVISLTKGNAALVGPKQYTSYRELDGKRIGDPGLGTVHDAVLSFVEQSQGLKFKRVFGKVTDIAVMLGKGEVDAFIGWEPASALAIAQGHDLHYIAQLPPIANLESLELVVQPSFAADKPQAVDGLVRGILRGMQFIKTHPREKTAEIIATKMGDPKLLPVVADALGSVIVTDPRVDMPSAAIILKTIAHQGKIPEELVKDPGAWLGQYLDYSFLDRAQKSLAPAQ